MVGAPGCKPGEDLLFADGLEIPCVESHVHTSRIGAVGNVLMRMAVEQPAFGGRRHIGELVPVARPVAVFFGQCRESGEVAHGDALLRGRHRYFAGFIENGKFHVDFAVVIDGLEHVFV